MTGSAVKMGAPKQKWTPEEEAALRAGVDKYGRGKWRAIQKDADLGPCLMLRSNVDLKDKWRNMSVTTHGFGSKDKGYRVVALNSDVDTSYIELATSSFAMPGFESKAIVVHSSPIKDKNPLGPRYDNLIMEAISSLEEPSGSTRNKIADYIEDHYSVPSSFKNLLNQKLKTLTLQGKLTKVRQNYIANEHLENSIEEKCCKLWLQNGQHNDGIKYEQVKRKRMQKFPRACKKTSSMVKAIKMKRKADVTSNEAVTAAETSRVAAQAVAEAEAAAAAAEEAARIAEIAEAEWKAAEAAAEAVKAAFATKNAKKHMNSDSRLHNLIL